MLLWSLGYRDAEDAYHRSGLFALQVNSNRVPPALKKTTPAFSIHHPNKALERGYILKRSEHRTWSAALKQDEVVCLPDEIPL